MAVKRLNFDHVRFNIASHLEQTLDAGKLSFEVEEAQRDRQAGALGNVVEPGFPVRDFGSSPFRRDDYRQASATLKGVNSALHQISLA